eukprot:scaffold146960_cov30-Tisochrysis_lutea.AAC.3
MERDARDVVIVALIIALFGAHWVVHDGESRRAVEHPAVGQRKDVRRAVVTAQPIVAVHKLATKRERRWQRRARDEPRVKVRRHMHARLRKAVADRERNGLARRRRHVTLTFPPTLAVKGRPKGGPAARAC